MSEELKELRKITRVLSLAHSDALEKEISKYASTDERKKTWVLIDGQRSADEIVENVSISQRAVYKFLKILELAELIENRWGKPPSKLIDFVPASWVELLESDGGKRNDKDS